MNKKREELSLTAVKLAEKLLKKKEGGLEELRIYKFKDEISEADDELTEEIHTEFCEDLEAVQEELIKKYGKPAHKGKSDSKYIPLGGVFRYAWWKVGDRPLFVAAHHEDRGIPIFLWLGTLKK